MGETVIRLDADVESITVKLKKVGEAQKKLGGEFAKSIDDSSKKMTSAFDAPLKKMLGMVSAAALIRAQVAALDSLQDKISNRARGANAQSMSAEQASMRAGGDRAANFGWINTHGSHLTTQAGRTQFLAGIGDLQEERRAKGLPALSPAMVKHLEDTYTRGGDATFDEGGKDIRAAAREFPMAPDIGLRRRLAGRLGRKAGKSSINDMIDESLSKTSIEARNAYAARDDQEQVNMREYELGSQAGHQRVLARGPAARRWEQDHPLKDANWTDTVFGKKDKYFEKNPDTGESTDDHLRKINKNIERQFHQNTPVLPNLDARREPRK